MDLAPSRSSEAPRITLSDIRNDLDKMVVGVSSSMALSTDELRAILTQGLIQVDTIGTCFQDLHSTAHTVFDT